MSDKKLTLGEYVIAGGIAGTTEVCAMYPLDVVKTRFQLAVGGERASVVGTLRQIVQADGFGALYRGIASPIAAEAPKRATKFGCNELYKELLTLPDGSLTVPRYVASGALAGMTEAIGNCPFEVVKVRMQAHENVGRFKNTADALFQTLRGEGVLALYRGFEAQLWRNGMHVLREKFPTQHKDGAGKHFHSFLLGSIGGTVATSLNTPFDVVKSRFQNVGSSGGWALPELVRVARSEGVAALYKGFVPKVMRLSAGGGIMIVAFDLVCSYIRK